MSAVTEHEVRDKLSQRLGRGGVRLSYAQAAWLLAYLDNSVRCPEVLRPKLAVPPELVPLRHRAAVAAEVHEAHERALAVLAA